MAKVRVVCDSACDIPSALIAKYDMDIVPLSIRFGDEEFVDGKDLTHDEFWAKCRASKVLPETSAPSPGAFHAAYEKAKSDGYDGVIVIALSSELSATYQAAVLGAETTTDIAVVVFDSKAVSMGQGLIALGVAEKATSGASLSDLEACARELQGRMSVVGTPDTLEHLIKGGRLKGAKALVGSMLSIKPLLELRDGVVTEAGRQRTRSKALSSLVASAEAAAPLQYLSICHGAANDLAVVEKALANVKVENAIIVSDVGPVVGTHGGPGIVCLCWITA